jgi:hypothetical protein
LSIVKLISSEFEPFFISISNIQRHLFLLILPILTLHYLKTVVILMDVKWWLIVVLVSIFPNKNYAHLFICSLATFYLFMRNIQVIHPYFNWALLPLVDL